MPNFQYVTVANVMTSTYRTTVKLIKGLGLSHDKPASEQFYTAILLDQHDLLVCVFIEAS